MKNKIIIVMLLAFAVAPQWTSAEEKEKKSAAGLLPKEGDIALGIDMSPVFSYFGNIFNGNMSNGLDQFGGKIWSKDVNAVIKPNVSIVGKYFVTDNIAARVNIGILYDNQTSRKYARDDEAFAIDPFSEAKVIDAANKVSSGYSLALGAEYRYGEKRLQGVFGASLLYASQNDRRSIAYANKITEINQEPTRTAAFDYGITTNLNTTHTGTPWTRLYLLEDYSNAKDKYFGLQLSAGAEYFFTDYLALGGEVSLAAYQMFGAQRYEVVEGFNQATKTVDVHTDLVSPGNRTFHLGTENIGARFYLMFYF
ncbi:MAG: hypothetical protein LBS07_04655 [Prevotellaceae bacterium]|jgi:hypothetical protein|nr:hypothetical protein [Prevotellaceae bacterium]